MCTNPLDAYFSMGGRGPGFRLDSTALWRGYVGKWEIAGDRLYLIGLQATLDDGTRASLATLFPDFPARVFAHWYSGALRIPQGKQLKYVHMGYDSTFERDLLLDVARGVVQATRVRQNGRGGSEDAPEGYGIGAWTDLRRTPTDSGESA